MKLFEIHNTPNVTTKVADTISPEEKHKHQRLDIIGHLFPSLPDFYIMDEIDPKWFNMSVVEFNNWMKLLYSPYCSFAIQQHNIYEVDIDLQKNTILWDASFIPAFFTLVSSGIVSTCTLQDAIDWVEKNAPTFGTELSTQEAMLTLNLFKEIIQKSKRPLTFLQYTESDGELTTFTAFSVPKTITKENSV